MSLPPMPSNLRGYKTGAPNGFMTLKSPSRAVTQKAQDLLKNKMGDEFNFSIEGINYFARLEPHYHPPGYKSGPNGWHKGVSVYVSKDKQPITKDTIPVEKLPDASKLPEEIPQKSKYNFISQLNKILNSLMG